MSAPEQAVRYLTVKDIMNPDVLAAQADWSLEQLAEFLVEHDISGAPVISSEGELIGVVSETDIVRHTSAPESDAPSVGTHEYYLQTLQRQMAPEEMAAFRIETESLVTVRDIMTPMIFEVSEDTTVQQAADTMLKGHIHRVFVTRDKKVRGIVTALDMLKVICDM